MSSTLITIIAVIAVGLLAYVLGEWIVRRVFGAGDEDRSAS